MWGAAQWRPAGPGSSKGRSTCGKHGVKQSTVCKVSKKYIKGIFQNIYHKKIKSKYDIYNYKNHVIYWI